MKYLSLFILITMVVITVGLTSIIVYYFKNSFIDKAKDKVQAVKLQYEQSVMNDVNKRIAYDMVSLKLSKKGIRYRLGANLTPLEYFVLRLLAALAVGLIGMLVYPLFVFVGLIAGYVLVPLYFDEKNKEDNENMMDDIAQMLSTFSLQMKSNMFASKIAYECYLAAGQPRLKQALLELSTEIEKFGNIKDAIVSFRNKFDNMYIDSFSKTLEQAEETGRVVEMLEDMEAQIDGINEAINIRQEKKVERTTFAFAMIIFIAAMGFVLFTLIRTFEPSMQGIF